MYLDKLFNMQQKLDERILNRFPELENVDLLPKKILSLQVELGELANEWRGFKFWSEDREPRTEVYSIDYLVLPDGTEIEQARNPLLEEYVDCLHFILSIGLEKEFGNRDFPYLHEANFGIYTETDTIEQFINTFTAISEFLVNDDLESFEELFLYFIGLGKHLGFEWEQIEQDYIQKNSVNHQRQQEGY